MNERGASRAGELLHPERAQAMSKKSKKQQELEERPAPLRGDDVKEKVSAALASAEVRHEIQVEAKKRLAAQHNSRAASVVAETRDAHHRAIDGLKQSQEDDMSAHAKRHDVEVQWRKIKGHAESEKVESAAEALQEATAKKSQKHKGAMKKAEERRAARLQTVKEKGHADVEKVESAATKLGEQAEAKAAKLEAAAAAAAARRAAKIGAIAAKGAAESEKVERVVGHPLALSASTAYGASPSPLAKHASPAPSSPDSVFWLPGASPPPPEPRKPSPRPLQYGEASMMLTLMRAGAPNEELLRARGAAELAAIAAKYNIPLEGARPSAAAVY